MRYDFKIPLPASHISKSLGTLHLVETPDLQEDRSELHGDRSELHEDRSVDIALRLLMLVLPGDETVRLLSLDATDKVLHLRVDDDENIKEHVFFFFAP